MSENNLINDIQETRFRICNALLISFAILAIPALAASLYRITVIGWQPIIAVHIVIAIALWSFVFLRARIPYKYQAGLIVIFFIIIGLGGIFQFGLIAGGTVFIVASAPIATLLFGGRIGIATLIIVLCAATGIGLLTISGYLEYKFDIAAYAVAPSSWLTSIFGWGLASTVLTVSLHVFNRKLINALTVSRQHQEALRDHQATLEKAIDEREKALSEIKTLRGIIPICSYCHNIRNDEGAWGQLETYISQHSDAKFSHGICPNCIEKVRSDAGLDKE